VTRVTLNPDV